MIVLGRGLMSSLSNNNNKIITSIINNNYYYYLIISLVSGFQLDILSTFINHRHKFMQLE